MIGQVSDPAAIESVGNGAISTASARTTDLRKGALLIGACVVAIVVLTVVLEAISVHSNTPNSDAATIVLEGQSMASGQLGLHGWALSLDSFWAIDAVIYMIAVALVGVKASFLYVIPSLIAATVIVLGGTIARGHQRGIAAAVGIATVVALLAFPSHALALDLLQGPLHIGTTLWCLIAFYALRNGRFGWGWVVAVVFLAAGLLGDLQALAIGTIPVGLAGIASSARCRSWRAGFAPMSAAVVSVVGALVVHELAKAIGSFTLIQANPRASWSAMRANISLLGNYFPKLVGAGTNGFGSGGAPYVTQFAHGLALIAIIAGTLAAVGGLVVGVVRGSDRTPTNASPDWRVEDPIVFAFVGGLAIFVGLTVVPSLSYARYLVPSVIFGTILAGRLMTRTAARMVARRDDLPRSIPITAGAFCCAVIAVLAIGAGYIVAQPTSPSEYAVVGNFLEAHGLHQGVGDYWSASIVTVESNGNVHVRGVTQAPNGKLVRYERESTSAWYAGQKFSFVVFNPTLQIGDVNQLTAHATWGRFQHAYHLDGLVVLVYRHPFVVSPNGIAN